MSTVVWIGRVRRGTELRTLRGAGLDCRLFFDMATAERFILHHGTLAATSSTTTKVGGSQAGSPTDLHGTTSSRNSAGGRLGSGGTGSQPRKCPMFAVVVAENSAVEILTLPGIREVIEHHKIHVYVVTNAATDSVLDRDMVIRKLSSTNTASGGTTSTGVMGSGFPADGVHLSPPRSSTATGGVQQSSAGSRSNATASTGGTFLSSLSSGPAQRSATATLTEPSYHSGTLDIRQLSDASGGSNSSFAPVQPADIEAMKREFNLPDSVIFMAGEKVQEEIVHRYLAQVTEGDETPGSRASSLASGSQPQGLGPMQQLSVPPPEGVPAGAIFVGEGPSGSVWRLPHEAQVDGERHEGAGGGGPSSTTPETKTVTSTALRVLPKDLRKPLYYEILREQMKLRHPKISGPLKIEPPEEPRFVYYNLFHSHLERSFRGEVVPESVLIRVLLSLLEALNEIHLRGFVVRSVSPYLIAFDHDDVIRVATTYLVPKQHREAFPNWIIFSYCAPESIAANQWNERSDIWGVGCLTLRMVTGMNPWQKMTDHEMKSEAKKMMSSSSSGDGTVLLNSFLRTIPPNTNPLITEIITRCMQVDPKKRPTPTELLQSELFQPLLRVTAGTGVGADDSELDMAAHRLMVLDTDSQEYSTVRDAVGRALLKQADPTMGTVELLGAAKVENATLKRRFDMKFSYIGNKTIGFYGAPPGAIPSLLRYGVLRSGHRLNPVHNPKNMSNWVEKGTIGSTKLGVYVMKQPTLATKYTSKEPLAVGTIVDVIMFEVALGDCKTLAKHERRFFTAEELKEEPHHSFSNDTEYYLREEVQLNPICVVRLKVCPPTVSIPSMSTYYHILMNKDLGSGSFGSVKMAIQYPRGIPVAVKIFDVQHSDERFCRAEFDTLLRLSDFRHIMRVYHYEIKDDVAYMFMELLTTSLLDLVKGFGPMREEVVKHYMIQAAAGLESLRLEGLVHRDVKPANMMLGHDGTLKLTDFGLSPEIITENAAGGQSPFPVGSPAYWAPELLDGQPHTDASDVWALGASAVHMLSGATPYKHVGSNLRIEQLAYLIGSGMATPQVPDHVSPEFRALLTRCFASDAEQRPSLESLTNPAAYGIGVPSTAAGSTTGAGNTRQNTTQSMISTGMNREGTTESIVISYAGPSGSSDSWCYGDDQMSYGGTATGTWASEGGLSTTQGLEAFTASNGGQGTLAVGGAGVFATHSAPVLPAIREDSSHTSTGLESAVFNAAMRVHSNPTGASSSRFGGTNTTTTGAGSSSRSFADPFATGNTTTMSTGSNFATSGADPAEEQSGGESNPPALEAE